MKPNPMLPAVPAGTMARGTRPRGVPGWPGPRPYPQDRVRLTGGAPERVGLV
jgi:hypothetical protein